jgi:two-component system OmpR family sensor kinase
MVLRAGVERSLTHPGTPPEVLEALDTTLDQLNQLNELVDSLLTLARADEGRAPLTLEDCDLAEIVADVGETAGLLGEQHGLTVHTALPDHPVRLSVDRHRIHQLLLNLVTNALVHPSRRHGAPALGDTGVVADRRDSGTARSGDFPHIFDRFCGPTRTVLTGDRPGSGWAGYSKWIAEAHGGKSLCRWLGSTTITLPRGLWREPRRIGSRRRGPSVPTSSGLLFVCHFGHREKHRP